MPSINAVLLEHIRSNPGLTKTQLSAKIGESSTPDFVDTVVDQMVAEGLVARTGSDPTATYAVTTKVL